MRPKSLGHRSPVSGRDYTTLGVKQNDVSSKATNKESTPLGAALVETVVETVTEGKAVRDVHTAPPPVAKQQEENEAMDRKPPPASTRLIRPRVQAAPRVSAAPPVPPETAVATAPYPPTNITTDDNTSNDYASQKKRKQQLERALRNQDVGHVWQDDQLPDRHGVVPSAHAPSVPTHQPAVESRFANVNQKWCGYNPDTKTISKTGKGKNQISYVLAQAVQLEQQRIEQGTSNPNKNPHRANAKRKYGW